MFSPTGIFSFQVRLLFDSDGGHQEPFAIFNGRLWSNNGFHGVGDPSVSPSSWIDPQSQAFCSD
jgi:hypothetical protein